MKDERNARRFGECKAFELIEVPAMQRSGLILSLVAGLGGQDFVGYSVGRHSDSKGLIGNSIDNPIGREEYSSCDGLKL